MELDKAIKSVKQCKRFKSKKPNWRDILEAVDAMLYAPMAGNNFTPRLVLVDDPEKIEKISDCTQQPFVNQAHYVLVVCSDPFRLNNAYGKEGEKYNKYQIGAAIQNFLLKIEELKLSTCWVKLFHEDRIKQILSIPEKINIEALLPIGYEYEKRRTKEIKTDIDKVLFFNKYKSKKMDPPKKVEGY